MKAKKAMGFVVSLPNRPGSFADLSKELAARDIDIRAFMLYTSYIMNVPDALQVMGTCKMIVGSDEKARQVFRDLGLSRAVM